MKHLIISILIFAGYILPASGSNPIRIKIIDENSAALSNCNVSVKNKCYLLTDDAGCVAIPLAYCAIGDTIQASYMGYENLFIIISPQFLQNKQEQVFQLVQATYSLDDVTVTGNAEKLFEKKKRNMLLPYSGKHIVNVLAYTSRDVNGEQMEASGKLKILFKMLEQETLENTCTTDTLLLRHIKRSLVLATSIPYICCFQKFRKLCDVYYLGVQGDRYVFRFDVKPEAVTHPSFEFQTGDEFSKIIYVNKNGFISRIETRADVKSGKSKSYNLSVNYIERSGKMAPAYIELALIKEKLYLELICTY